MTIGERIKQRRIELGLSQEDLAKRLGNKSRASVCTVEKDKEDLTTDRIKKYAEALETTPAYLMGWEDDGIPTVIRKLDRKPKTDIDSNNILMGLYQNNPDEFNRAEHLFEMYQNASPEVRSAVELLLKSAQQKP